MTRVRVRRRARSASTRTVHPFCASFATTDIRVTTRYSPRTTSESLFSCMHEIGPRPLRAGRQPDARAHARSRAAARPAFHESQSRLWENVVGRSLPFWRWFYPQAAGGVPGRARRHVRSSASTARSTGSAVVHPRRRRRGDVRHAHHPAVRARAGAVRRHALDGRSAGRLERALRGVPRAAPCPRTGSGVLQDVHWSCGGVRLLPDLPARQRDLRADLGGGAARTSATSRSGSSRATSRI